MAQVVTFEGYRPVARYDATAWTQVRIEESDTDTLSDTTVWAEVETIALSPVDADPADPAFRDFTTELASDDPDLWYRIVFVDASGDESLPTDPVQNTQDSAAFATAAELYPILNIRTATTAQEAKANRVLAAAAWEIRTELDFEDDLALDAGALALCAMVNLGRAAELWKQEETQLGIMLGIDQGSVYVGTDTWKRWAIMLHPAKDRFGFA
jgi:hypothetical protein